MQIEDPRWRGYARLQQTLMGRHALNDETTGLERALDALLCERPRDGESHDDMAIRVSASARRRERRRRVLTVLADDRVRDEARVRSAGAPEAAAHAHLMLASIVSRADAGERRLVFDLATGRAADDMSPPVFRKRLQRFRAGVRAWAAGGTTQVPVQVANTLPTRASYVIFPRAEGE